MAGTVSLHLGDCRDGMRGLPDKSFDHAMLDSAYEKEAHSKGRRIVTGSWRQAKDRPHEREIREAAISYPPVTDEERIEVAAQVARLTKRWILAFCQVEAAMLWRAAFEAAGAEYKRTGIYWKTDAQPQYNGQMPGVGFEAIVICHGLPRKGPTRWNGGGKCARWDSSADARFGKKLSVDGQKPLSLMRQLVTDFTDEGERILVPYSGAATTETACMELGRDFESWELKEAHYLIGQARLRDTVRQEKLFAKPMKQVSLLGDK